MGVSGPCRRFAIARTDQPVLVEWAEEASVNGNVDWPQWERRVADLRTKAATLLGATTEEIALLRSTSEGVNLVAEGFPWEPGDNVVTLADEFPTNQYPWLNQAGRGVETRRVAVGPEGVALDAIAGACDRRTRIVAISWVSYCTGRRLDLVRLAEIAHQRGALLFVDGIQGLGVLPLDVGSTPIDFLAADGHKWLLGPEGAGLFYIRREHLARLRPVGVGWNSVVHARDFSRIELKLKDSAERYEGGSQNMAGMIALGESVALLLRFGVAAIAERIFAITDLACAALVDRREDRQRSPPGEQERNRRVRDAGERSGGDSPGMPEAECRSQLPWRPPADQSACLQQRRRRRPACGRGPRGITAACVAGAAVLGVPPSAVGPGVL